MSVIFLVIEEEPYHQFKLQVKSEGHDPETEVGYGCSLKFTYTPNYPDETLIVEILDAVNMDDMQIERLKERLEKDSEENLGMVS
jgi:RWD domain